MRPEEVLAAVGREQRLHHFPAPLSGGEQQRVAIARAVAKRPDVLLCDEPTRALDSTPGILVLEALEYVTRELGTATAVITHNAAIAAIADRVVRIADGRVIDEQVRCPKDKREGTSIATLTRFRTLNRKLIRDLWAMRAGARNRGGHRGRCDDVRQFSVERRVAAADARVVMDVTLDVPGMAEPAVGRLISLAEYGAAAQHRDPEAGPVG